MKPIVKLVPIVLILLFSTCDRRTSKKVHLENAVSQFNETLPPVETRTYHPKDFLEIQTDSIISSTFKVSIKNYTNMAAHIMMDDASSNAKKHSKAHRVIESDVLVNVNDRIIFNQHISAAYFKQITPSPFWEAASLEHVWVNQEHSNNDFLTLNLSFINPQLSAYRLYELRLDTSGKETLTLLEETT